MCSRSPGSPRRAATSSSRARRAPETSSSSSPRSTCCARSPCVRTGICRWRCGGRAPAMRSPPAARSASRSGSRLPSCWRDGPRRRDRTTQGGTGSGAGHERGADSRVLGLPSLGQSPALRRRRGARRGRRRARDRRAVQRVQPARDARAHVRRRLVLARDVAREPARDRPRRSDLWAGHPDTRRAPQAMGRPRGRAAGLPRRARRGRSVAIARRPDARGPDVQSAARHAAASRSDPRGPPPERARHDAHDDERLAAGHRHQLVLPREVPKGGAHVSGELVTIPARGGKAAQASAGQHIKVVNTHGTQVVDAWAFNARDLTEWMSMEASRASFMKLAAAVGDTFVTNQRKPILTLVEDTSRCAHDTLMAPCDRWRYGLLGVEGYHDNCRDNLHSALANLGVVIRATPPSLNLFMNIPWTPDGQLAWGEPVSSPGGYVVFRAEMDLVVALSACPQDILPINGRTGRTTEAHFAII